MKYIFIAVLFHVSVNAIGQSISNLNDDFSKKYFQYLYNFQFNNVRTLLNSEEINNKLDNHLFRANYYFWKTVSGDSTLDYFNLCKQELRNQEKILETAKLSWRDSIFYYSLIYSYQMRIELMNENYLNAAKILNSTIRYFEGALDSKDNYEPLIFLKGMYNYFVAYAGDRYSLLKIPLKLYKPGNRTLGLNQLVTCSRSKNIIIKTEALYFLMKIYLYTENDYNKAKYYAEALLQLHPENIIFRREYFLALLKLNRFKDAEVEKKKILRLVDQNKQLTTFEKNYFRQLFK